MATRKKEILVPVGETLWCEKCECEMECINTDAPEGEKFVYSCPKCGDTFTTDSRFPRIQYYTQEDLQAESMHTPQGKAQREQLIRQAIENHDFETLERLGIHVQPLYVDPKQRPS